MTQRYLHGVHDIGAEDLHGDKPGWTLDTVEVGLNTRAQGNDYRPITSRGIGVIVRINHGYGSTGTLPLPHQYPEFAAACASFVATSQGISYVCIGNEPNGEWERPNGVVITAEQYARCFTLCRNAIKQANSSVKVMPAAIGPYHAAPTNWLTYLAEVLTRIGQNGGCDAINIHAYTRSMNPDDITSGAKMGPPLQDQFSGFFTYLDALSAVPAIMRRLPAVITEFDVYGPWLDQNTGVIQAMYAEVNRWNSRPDTQKIIAAICFRWLGPPEVENQFDWEMRNKPQLLQDLRAAIGRGYQSPPVNNGTNAVSEQEKTHLPYTPHDAPPTAPQLPPRQWDERLTQRGVTLETPVVKPGREFWRVVKAQWFDEQQAGGRHYIYVEAITPDGRLVANEPFDVRWPSGGATESTKASRGFEAGNFPMSPSLTEFSVAMGDGVPSETVRGIGMGANGNPGIHTSTLVTFQLTTMPQSTTQPTPTPQEPVIAPGPTPPQPATFYVAVRDGANLRAAPSVEAAKLGAFAYGQALTVISATPNRDWLQVAWDGQTGWVLAALLGVEQPPLLPAPEPAPPATTPTGDDWQRAYPIVLEIEGGYSTDRRDKGNWTGGAVGAGELKGTKYGISAASYPHLDIASLTREQALEIYRRDYWVASGANQMPWPLSLVHFDTYVQNKNAAKRFLSESSGNVMLYLAKRLDWYTRIDDWHVWSAGWARRVAKMMTEASKL